MLAVYLALFGAKAIGVGKPLMAGITLLSTGCAYWYLSRSSRRCIDSCAGSKRIISIIWRVASSPVRFSWGVSV